MRSSLTATTSYGQRRPGCRGVRASQLATVRCAISYADIGAATRRQGGIKCAARVAVGLAGGVELHLRLRGKRAPGCGKNRGNGLSHEADPDLSESWQPGGSLVAANSFGWADCEAKKLRTRRASKSVFEPFAQDRGPRPERSTSVQRRCGNVWRCCTPCWGCAAKRDTWMAKHMPDHWALHGQKHCASVKRTAPHKTTLELRDSLVHSIAGGAGGRAAAEPASGGCARSACLVQQRQLIVHCYMPLSALDWHMAACSGREARPGAGSFGHQGRLRDLLARNFLRDIQVVNLREREGRITSDGANIWLMWDALALGSEPGNESNQASKRSVVEKTGCRQHRHTRGQSRKGQGAGEVVIGSTGAHGNPRPPTQEHHPKSS